MSTKRFEISLPADILLYIIDCLVESSPLTPVALPPSHPITRTLVALTRTSHVTYHAARRLLYSQCLYIDSALRLHQLLSSLSAPARMIDPSQAQLRSLLHAPILRHITSLYLSPFPSESINSLRIANSLSALFSLIAPTLRRLVIDMPLRSLRPSDDHLHVRHVLRQAFSQLVALELFCSVRDELYLDCEESRLDAEVNEPFVWALCWQKLRTLALYNQDVSDLRFWQGLGRLASLEMLVLTRSDCLEEFDLKREWDRVCGDRERGLDILLVNVESQHVVRLGRAGWSKEDKVTVREVNVPFSYYGDENEIDLCQQWVKRKILRGEAIF